MSKPLHADAWYETPDVDQLRQEFQNTYDAIDLAVGGIDLSAYYTKTEITNILDSYYTESEVDALLAALDYYTTTEINNNFLALTGGTLSGAIVVQRTGGDYFVMEDTDDNRDMRFFFASSGRFALVPRNAGTSIFTSEFGYDFDINEWYAESQFSADKIVVGTAFVDSATERENIINILAGSSADGSSNGIAWYETNNAFGMKLGYDGVGTGDANALRFYNSDDAAIVTIQNGGNVGIGTTSPAEMLHLASTGPVTLRLEADTDNATETDVVKIELSQDGDLVNGYLGFTDDNRLVLDHASANNDFHIRMGGTDRISITSGGAIVFNASLYIPTFIFHSGDTNTYIGFPANDYFEVRTSGIRQFSVNSAGNVQVYTNLIIPVR